MKYNAKTSSKIVICHLNNIDCLWSYSDVTVSSALPRFNALSALGVSASTAGPQAVYTGHVRDDIMFAGCLLVVQQDSVLK